MVLSAMQGKQELPEEIKQSATPSTAARHLIDGPRVTETAWVGEFGS